METASIGPRVIANTREDYDSIEAMNWSTLKYIATSPKLFRHRRSNPEKSKADYVVGGAAHSRVLEPETFDQKFKLYEALRRGKAWDTWRAENPGVTGLIASEWSEVMALSKTAAEDPEIRKMLDGTRREVSVVWTDRGTGLLCKARVDAFSRKVVIDLKTTRDCGEKAFGRDAALKLYHAQLAWYRDALVIAGEVDDDAESYLIALEKGGVNDSAIYRMPTYYMGMGQALYRDLLATFLACEQTGIWPGKVPRITDLEFPAYLDRVEGLTDD